MAKYCEAGVVAPIVEDVAQQNHVGAVGIRARDQICGFGGEAVAETARLYTFTGNTAHGLEIRDDALQVGMLETDRDRLPAWATCHIHDAAAVTEVEGFGDELSLRDAEAIHHVGESTQADGVGKRAHSRERPQVDCRLRRAENTEVGVAKFLMLELNQVEAHECHE